MTRPPLAAFALIACLSLPFSRLDAEKAHRATRKVPKVELTLSGPTTVGADYSLESQRYNVLLTNRSAEPLVFFVRGEYLVNARWDWTVTDAKGGFVGMEYFSRGYCGTFPHPSEEQIKAAHRIHDEEVVTINPGESREFPVPAGPSDFYSFPSAGIYHLSVALTYAPPKAGEIHSQGVTRWNATDGDERWDFSELNPDAFHTLGNSLPVQATSTNWNLELTSSRRPQR